MNHKSDIESILRQVLSMPIQPDRFGEKQASADDALLDDILSRSSETVTPADQALQFLKSKFPLVDLAILQQEVNAAVNRVNQDHPVFVLNDRSAVDQFTKRAWGNGVVALGEAELRALLQGNSIGITVQDEYSQIIHLDNAAKTYAASFLTLKDHNHVIL